MEENKETEFYKASKAFGIVPSDNIYFFNQKRIMNMQFYEALYQYDSLGSIFHFYGLFLTSRVFERSFRRIKTNEKCFVCNRSQEDRRNIADCFKKRGLNVVGVVTYKMEF